MVAGILGLGFTDCRFRGQSCAAWGVYRGYVGVILG